MKHQYVLTILLLSFLQVILAQTCTSSSQCSNTGTAANCCGGQCSTYWSSACDNGNNCAAGEVWNMNSWGERKCLNITDPCDADPCKGRGKCVQRFTEHSDGSFFCTDCVNGLGGDYCELCSHSTQCTFGTAMNCCASQCVVGWTNTCKQYGCAKGEFFNTGSAKCVTGK